MSEIQKIKEECVKVVLNNDLDLIEKRDELDILLEKIEKPLKQKTLFDIFIKPLRFNSSHLRNRLVENYALAMHYFTQNDFDYISIIMGTEGTGKSTLALNFAITLNKLDPSRDFRVDDIIYAWHKHDEVIEKILSSENRIILFDEGRPFFDLRNSMSSERLEKLEIITTERWRRNIFLICISDISEIDKYFRERRARNVFVVPDRKIFFALQNRGFFGMSEDRFMLDRLNFEMNVSNVVDYQISLNLLKKLPTCFGYGFFDAIDKESLIWKEYMEYKKKTSEKYKKKNGIRLLTHYQNI